jgi:hypothetical protein
MSGHFDWTPVHHLPDPKLVGFVPLDSDLQHARAGDATRNGMPEPKPYRWNVAGQEREREVAARLAVIRAEAARRHAARQGVPGA